MSLRKLNWFVFGLGCAKYGPPHYYPYEFLRTPSRTKLFTSFLNSYSFTFGTVYGCENVGLAFYFIFKPTRSMFHFRVFH